jgi:adenosylmethionine-8-amino-7-oxononanoate aminotransferase
VRQCGFVAGIEMADAETAGEVCLRARDHGLLTRNIWETIALLPPLCTTDEQLGRAVLALTRAMEKIEMEGRALSRPGRHGGRPSMSRR